MTDSVTRGQRFSRRNPCPVCRGFDQMDRGQGKRCSGYMGHDGKYIHCSRPELAGELAQEKNSETYAHLAAGPCRCGVEHSPGNAKPRTDGIEATYDYVDEAGDLLFQVVRKVGKKFLQRRPEGDGWVWSLGDVRRVLYRLPEILGSDGPVWIVEGEKDANALARHGLTATCNPHGAGKWRGVAKHAAEILKGRDVIVCPDQDEPGKKHGAEVARALKKVGRVVVLNVDGAKDVAEWLGKGGDVAALRERAQGLLDAPPPEPKVSAVNGDWAKALLVKPDSNTLRPIIANAVTILAHHPAWAGVIAYDDFAEGVAMTRAAPWRVQDAGMARALGEWSELDTTRLQNWLAENFGLDIGHDAAFAAVQLVADRVHVHPVRDWLLSLRWDGTRRLPTWLCEVFGADDTPLVRAMGTAWLVSAVARIFQPGCQVDTVLVLEGNPGMKKSSVLRELFGDAYFFEMSVADIANKDAMQVLRCKWAGEFPEIDSLSRSEWGHVKSYITRRVDRYRESYGRKAGDYPRQVIFGASTNKTEWIGDETGGTGRRIWPVRCRRGDDDSVRLVRQIREQLFAEARVRFESKEAWHFVDPELVDAEREEQAARRKPDDWTPVVAAWLNRPSEVGSLADQGITTGDALIGACKLDIGKVTPGDTMRMGAVLRDLGWVPGRQSRRHGAVVRLYRPALAGEVPGPVMVPSGGPLDVLEPGEDSFPPVNGEGVYSGE